MVEEVKKYACPYTGKLFDTPEEAQNYVKPTPAILRHGSVLRLCEVLVCRKTNSKVSLDGELTSVKTENLFKYDGERHSKLKESYDALIAQKEAHAGLCKEFNTEDLTPYKEQKTKSEK